MLLQDVNAEWKLGSGRYFPSRFESLVPLLSAYAYQEAFSLVRLTRSLRRGAQCGRSGQGSGHLAGGAAVLLGESLGIRDGRQALPVLQHLVEPEPGRAQGRGCFLGERGRERQDNRFLAFVAGASFAGEGPAAEGGPLFYLLGVARPVARR